MAGIIHDHIHTVPNTILITGNFKSTPENVPIGQGLMKPGYSTINIGLYMYLDKYTREKMTLY